MLLTLAAGQGGVEGRLWVVGVAFVQRVEEAGLGGRLQGHWPFHVVIVGPNLPDLVDGENGHLLEVRPVRLRPEGMSAVHPGGPGRSAPRLHAGAGARRSQRSRHIR